MSTLGVDVKVNYKQLQEAAKNVTNLKKELSEVSKTPHKINIYEAKSGISDEAFAQRATPSAAIDRQNRILQQSLRDLVNESRRSTWRERYRIMTPEEREASGGGGGPSMPGASGGMFSRGLRYAGRMAGYAAAIGGGFSLLSFLHNSVNQAANYGAGEADLTMRGGQIDRRVFASLGYDPLEALGMTDTIGGRTDFTGKQLNHLVYQAADKARLMGVSGQSVSNYVAGTYAATGAGGDEYGKQLKYLRDTAVALGARGRIEEVLHNNQQIMSTIVQGRGGKELSSDERLGMLTMQMGLWNTPGQIGKGASGTNILATMDQSIRGGGGTPGEKIFLAQALGVEGVKSLKDLWEFEKRMNEGGSRRNVKAVLDYSKKIAAQLGYSPEDTEQFAMRNVRDVLHLNENQTEAVFSSKFLESLEGAPVKALKKMQGTAEGRKRLGAADIDPFSLKGNQHRRTVAGFANTELEIGEKVLPWVDKSKDALTRGIDEFGKGNYLNALTESLKDNPLGLLMLTGMGLNAAGNLIGPATSAVAGAGAGAVAGAGAGAATRTATKTIGGKAFRWVPGVGWVIAALPMWDQNAGDAGEDEIMRKINSGTNPTIAKREVYGENNNQNEPGIGGLATAIWALVTELRVWLHKVNGDPIYNPNQPRYQTQN